jgi:hypothetical protein
LTSVLGSFVEALNKMAVSTPSEPINGGFVEALNKMAVSTPPEPINAGFASMPATDMKTMFSDLINASKNTMGTVPTNQTININVSANEKDLSQRITNEIRAYFYQEHVNNMA